MRSSPTIAKPAQSSTETGSGTLSALTLEVEEVEDDELLDEDELEEDDDELFDVRLIVTPGVCDRIWGGSSTFVTLSEKLSTPPAAKP
jgi:hypothetical protein